jgi:hypothetical protein
MRSSVSGPLWPPPGLDFEYWASTQPGPTWCHGTPAGTAAAVRCWPEARLAVAPAMSIPAAARAAIGAFHKFMHG